MAFTWNGANVISQDWNYLVMFYAACRERAWAAGGEEFPGSTMVWMDGVTTCTSITPTSITLNNWTLPNTDNIVRIINGLPTDPVDVVLPHSWALVVWSDNYTAPQCILKGQCTHWDSASSTMTMTWSNAWRRRWGPDGLAQFVGKRVVLIANGASWPWWHERMPERPSDFPIVSGDVLSRGPFTVSAVTVDGTGTWFQAAGHSFVVGDSVVVTGGPLNGTPETVTALRDDPDGTRWVKLGSPGVWTVPYATGWTMKHLANVLPLSVTWRKDGSAVAAAGLHVVWNNNRWVISSITSSGWLALRLESGETELPLSTPGYGAVIAADGYWADAAKHHAFEGYTGLYQSQQDTVLANDSYRGLFGSRYIPVYSITVDFGGGPLSYQIKDVDMWRPYSGDAEEPAICMNPNVTKSVRSMQMFIDGVSQGFVPMKEYVGAKAIPSLYTRIFVDAGISGSREALTLTWPTYGGYPLINVAASCPVPAWYKPEMGSLRYAVVCDTMGDRVMQTGSISPSGGTFTFTFDALYDYYQDGHYVWWGDSETPVGSYSVFLTPTWTREVPAGFRYMYSKTCVLPAVWTDPDTGVMSALPPSDDPEKCGAFYKRPADTLYSEGGSFTTNDQARYLGDSCFEPPTMIIPSPLAYAPDNVYRAKYYTGKPQSWQTPNTVTGTLTDWGGFYLRDGSQTWHIEGDRFAHSAVAGSGSTTGFAASGKSLSAFWAAPDMLGEPRFIDFIAEITLDGVVYPRVVRGHNLATQTVSWTEPLPRAVAAGDTIVLREPMYELNRWQERSLTITFPACDVPRIGGGAPIHFDAVAEKVTTITHNDATRLFFAAIPGVEWSRVDGGNTYTRTGATYAISERMPGTVWKWDGSKWVVPDDPNQLGAAPTRLIRWGAVNDWTYLDTQESLNPFQQMKLALDLMQWTRGSAGVSPYSDLANTVKGVVLTIPSSWGRTLISGWPRATLDLGMSAQAAAGILLDLGTYPMWQYTPGPYTYTEYTTDHAWATCSLYFGEASDYWHSGPDDCYKYGVTLVQRGADHDWAGGYARTGSYSKPGIDHLGGSVELYCYCDRLAPWHATAWNPNNSEYLYYLGPEDAYASVGGGSAAVDVIGSLILPPDPGFPSIDTSLMPSGPFDEGTGDVSSSTPEGWPYPPKAQKSWRGTVDAVWKWSMEYAP